MNKEIILIDGSVAIQFCNGWSPFSHYHVDKFEMDEVVFNSMQHAILARKAMLLGDMKLYNLICSTYAPSKLRELAKHEDPPGYDYEKEVAMVVNARFSTSEKAKQQLLATGNKFILFATKFDSVLGTGLAPTDPKNRDPTQWQGENILGKCLMQTREILHSKVLKVIFN